MGLSPNVILAANSKNRQNFPKIFSAYIPHKPQKFLEKFFSIFKIFATKAHLATVPKFIFIFAAFGPVLKAAGYKCKLRNKFFYIQII